MIKVAILASTLSMDTSLLDMYTRLAESGIVRVDVIDDVSKYDTSGIDRDAIVYDCVPTPKNPTTFSNVKKFDYSKFNKKDRNRKIYVSYRQCR